MLHLQDRRQFVLSAARRCLGVSLLPWAESAVRAAAAESSGSQKTPPAKSVIYLYMSGGMSHLDTFDPKPDNARVQGPIGTIASKVAGLRLGEFLPNLAQISDLYTVVRSVHHTQGNHEPGTYKVRTGYESRPDLIHPSLGAWTDKLLPRNNPRLPAYVRVGGLAGHPANGFFEVKHAPLPILKPDAGLQNGKMREGMTNEQFHRNLQLAAELDSDFMSRYRQSRVHAYADLYDDAVRMMTSSDLDAFDVNKEKPQLREQYGKTPFGAGCLLARRLVERGVRFIEVDHGGWDTHIDNHKGVSAACGPLDQTLPVLLADLQERGLLETTLVVLATEFGRTPEIDQNAGRNHHPVGFSCLLAGGGIGGGQVYGATDENGDRVARDAVSVMDFNATIGHAIGLPLLDAYAPTAGAQLFTVTGKDTDPDKGQPLLSLFS